MTSLFYIDQDLQYFSFLTCMKLYLVATMIMSQFSIIIWSDKCMHVSSYSDTVTELSDIWIEFLHSIYYLS